MPRLSFICVAYQRPIEIRVLVSSILAQTFKDFELLILHDGYEGMTEVEQSVSLFADPRVSFRVTDHRYNDFGHSLREYGLSYCRGELVGFTNDDNYYAPVYFEKLIGSLDQTPADFAYCDMVHSHYGWSYFQTEPRITKIDAGGWIARKSVLPTKWQDKSFNGDGVYVEQVMAGNPRVTKVPGVLFIHN